MNARATKNISLVLVSSLLVFAGWGCGDFLTNDAEHRDEADHGHAGAHHVGTGHSSGFFWWHSGYYRYYGGSGTVGGVGGGTGTNPGGHSGVAGGSARGGFGTTGHAAGG
jgi:hypothetical protein